MHPDRKPLTRWLFGACACVVLLSSGRANDPQGSSVPTAWTPRPEARLTIVCFLGTECPLAKLYAGRLQSIADEFASRQVDTIAVMSNTQDSAEEIEAYRTRHAIGFPVVLDHEQRIANQFGATRTPEVFVVDPSGQTRYQGRIDDQYAPGLVKSSPSQHDLHDAVASLLEGKEPREAKTAAVGCVIARPRKPITTVTTGPSVTFHHDVLPVLREHCLECHRSGEIGPMALTDYQEVIGWGDTILEVVDQHRMPPWHADPDVGSFVGARHFPRTARDTLARWLEQGMPEGNAESPGTAEAPKDSADASAVGWHLPEPPAEEFVMRQRPYSVPASGTVEYQYFVVDPHWETDRYVRAAQVIPGDRSVVHHAIVFVRPPDGADSRGIGWLGAYVPGQRAFALPEGHARKIPAGSKLVFQMHYTPNGRATEDISRVGVWFTEADRVTHTVSTMVAIDQHFEIPPGEGDFVVPLRLEHFPEGSTLLGLTPHMHLRGKAFEMSAKRGDAMEPLLRVPHYDFNWQHWYLLANPLDLDTVDSLEMEVRFDNSPRNPANPDAQSYVHWGDQTWNEMAVAFLDVAEPIEQPSEKPKSKSKARRLTAASEPSASRPTPESIEARVDTIFQKADKNGDGVILYEEAPLAFRWGGFHHFDTNRDRRLERTEVAEFLKPRY